MGIRYQHTTEWQEEAARLRAIQHQLFPRSGRTVVKMERKPAPLKPAPARVDKQLDALIAGEIPGAEDMRRKRRR